MTSKGETWYTAEREFEGQPLLLRFPEERNYARLTAELPFLAVIEHDLSQVNSNGLPTPEYNRTLATLDTSITSGMQCIVLVETYGGRRTYYGYYESRTKASDFFETAANSFPEECLELSIDEDPDWNFIRNYSKDFEFYGNAE